MAPRKFTAEQKAKIVAEYRAGKRTMAEIAARHSIGKSTLSSWLNPKKNTRGGGWKWTEEQVALTGGRWVNVRGVMRWEAAVAPDPTVDLTEFARRIEVEEAMFTEAEARQAHAAYAGGCRESRSVIGERVYHRRMKREKRAEKRVA